MKHAIRTAAFAFLACCVLYLSSHADRVDELQQRVDELEAEYTPATAGPAVLWEGE